MKKILVTGGAGYIGTTLIPMLLAKQYDVTVVDSLLFNNGDKLIPFVNNKNFNFVKGDVRDVELMSNLVKDKDVVIHLAALVGFPICREKGEKESFDVNTNATRLLVSLLGENQYGVSPRLRLDLLVNDLTYKAMTQKYAVIYESHFLRTFIHIKDLASSFLFAIENQDAMKSNVYNVGSNTMNYTKKEVCELIKEQIPDVYFHYADIGEDADKRNYQVSYDKINNLGFEVSVGVEQGIQELKKCIDLIQHELKYTNV